jgi:hypothetical protein
MDLLRAALQGSGSMTDETHVVLRQNLHGLVTGTLACMDSGRSTLAEVATDMIGLICEKLVLEASVMCPTVGVRNSDASADAVKYDAGTTINIALHHGIWRRDCLQL